MIYYNIPIWYGILIAFILSGFILYKSFKNEDKDFPDYSDPKNKLHP